MTGWQVLGIGAAVVAAVAIALVFNKLVRMRNLADNSWSDIDVQLKKRSDLIPSLVEVVKGYAGHERGTFEAVVAAREHAVSAKTVAERAGAENEIASALKRLFLLVESYPDLKANEQFQQLQSQLVATENDLADSRRYYNAVVRDFNTLVEWFPINLVAAAFRFRTKEFFRAEEEDRKAAPVRLS